MTPVVQALSVDEVVADGLPSGRLDRTDGAALLGRHGIRAHIGKRRAASPQLIQLRILLKRLCRVIRLVKIRLVVRQHNIGITAVFRHRFDRDSLRLYRFRLFRLCRRGLRRASAQTEQQRQQDGQSRHPAQYPSIHGFLLLFLPCCSLILPRTAKKVNDNLTIHSRSVILKISYLRGEYPA